MPRHNHRRGRRQQPKRRWIQKALEHHKEGSLHRQLNVRRGKIPLPLLEEAAAHPEHFRKRSDAVSLLGHRARLALTLRGFGGKKRKHRS